MSLYYDEDGIKIYNGDCLETLKKIPDESIDTVITSPPYWGLRDYNVGGQIGLESTMEEYLDQLLALTAELKRVLKKTGVMFWNHSDSYSGSQGHFDAKNPKARKGKLIPNQKDYRAKCLFLQNYRLILGMIDEQGWILRNTIIWNKPNHMPSSVKDRFANSYEPVFMLVKNKKYWFDLDAVRIPYTEKLNRWGGETIKANGHGSWDNGVGQNTYRNRNVRPNDLGKNPGDVWKISTKPFMEAHFATFPKKLIEPMIKSGCQLEGVVLDPFAGSGTTLVVAKQLGRKAIGIEISKEYCDIAVNRINKIQNNLF